MEIIIFYSKIDSFPIESISSYCHHHLPVKRAQILDTIQIFLILFIFCTNPFFSLLNSRAAGPHILWPNHLKWPPSPVAVCSQTYLLGPTPKWQWERPVWNDKLAKVPPSLKPFNYYDFLKETHICCNCIWALLWAHQPFATLAYWFQFTLQDTGRVIFSSRKPSPNSL